MREDPTALEPWRPDRDARDGSATEDRARRHNRSLRVLAGLLVLGLAGAGLLALHFADQLAQVRQETADARLALTRTAADLDAARAQVSVLSAQLKDERDAAQSRFRQLAAGSRRLQDLVSQAEAAPRDTHRLRWVSANGETVELADGSAYRIGPFDRLKTVRWRPGAQVKVLLTGTGLYARRLINVETGQAASADRR